MYTYDTHGNMTSMPHLAAIAWDHGDRMQHCDLGGGGDVWFVYDAAGNRVRKVQVNTSGSTVRERVYLGAWEVWRERSGTPLAIEHERQTLHVGDDRGKLALVETLTVEDGDPVATPVSSHRHQHGNHLGSASLELDDDAAVISYEEFHPFGTSSYVANDSGIQVSAKRFRYIGKERDEETGLYHLGARYYASWLGRWTAADPIGLGDGVNRYGYCRGNPVRLADGSGQRARPGDPDDLENPGSVDDQPYGTGMTDADQADLDQDVGEPAGATKGVPIGTPRDKALASLRFLREGLGIPLLRLEGAVARVDVQEADSNETTSFLGIWITINLTRNVLDAVVDVPGPLSGAKNAGNNSTQLLAPNVLGTLVHEATHAFVLTDPKAAETIAAEQGYYEGAPLEGGGVVEDAHLAVQEVAATYVAARVTTLLITHSELAKAEDALAAGDDFGRAKAAEFLQRAEARLSADPRNDAFGYVFRNGKQVNISKRISGSLASFLDRHVLRDGASEARIRLRTRAELLRKRLGT